WGTGEDNLFVRAPGGTPGPRSPVALPLGGQIKYSERRRKPGLGADLTENKNSQVF
ncbi:hypothetical protein SAMN02745885_02808, partial [Carboxydocella sporoproducens DSM 16521]